VVHAGNEGIIRSRSGANCIAGDLAVWLVECAPGALMAGTQQSCQLVAVGLQGSS